MIKTLAVPELDPASYHHNLLRLELPDGPIDLLPSDDGAHAVPVDGPLYAFSVWNPFGRPSTFDENRKWAATEAGDLRIPGAIYSADLTFAEQAVALTAAPEYAQSYTMRFGQPALLRWDAEALHVLRASDLEVIDTWPVRRAPVTTRTCVMDPGRVEGRCSPRGGPWVRASIEAGLLWKHEFTCKVAALRGCDLCHSQPRGAGAIGLVELSVPSRFSDPLVVGPV